MKKILMPTDFSISSKNAIKYSIQLFGKQDYTFTILNTYRIPYVSSEVHLSGADFSGEQENEKFEELRNSLEREFQGNLPEINFSFLIGDNVTVASQMVLNGDIYMIAMGTKGASGIKELLIGSNASNMIGDLNCPVLVIPAEAKFKSLKRIVLAVENEEEMEADTLLPLLEFAKTHNSELAIVHVLKDEDSVSLNASMISNLVGKINHSYTEIRNENVASAIQEFVESTDADMLCLINHKLGIFENLFHSSITKKMAMHTSIPLLALHS